VYVGLKADVNFVTAGAMIPCTICVCDVDGKPLSGIKVKFRIDGSESGSPERKFVLTSAASPSGFDAKSFQNGWEPQAPPLEIKAADNNDSIPLPPSDIGILPFTSVPSIYGTGPLTVPTISPNAPYGETDAQRVKREAREAKNKAEAEEADKLFQNIVADSAIRIPSHKIHGSGHIGIEATVQDDKGRTHRSMVWVWVENPRKDNEAADPPAPEHQG